MRLNNSPWCSGVERLQGDTTTITDSHPNGLTKDGVGGVICLHCSWQGDDRSPNNLRTHLKKFHSSDGIFARFSEKLAQV
ncbi:hypothetical protein DICVIV_10914 [Dictyocaulus viviparus]|uniref:Uncharacterized protein n=1 Tax=Dictyocaulus viviparus TaxID=29172 RepID=A0A0D8XES0_DICVI|nr:hypothetical protein DICVIV_10914 [Dictyocaulus viviparus]